MAGVSRNTRYVLKQNVQLAKPLSLARKTRNKAAVTSSPTEVSMQYGEKPLFSGGGAGLRSKGGGEGGG